jgi:hypothetical protein
VLSEAGDGPFVAGELPEDAQVADLTGTVRAAPEDRASLGLDADAESVGRRGACVEAPDVQAVER